jgi:hypothetical protein
LVTDYGMSGLESESEPEKRREEKRRSDFITN